MSVVRIFSMTCRCSRDQINSRMAHLVHQCVAHHLQSVEYITVEVKGYSYLTGKSTLKSIDIWFVEWSGNTETLLTFLYWLVSRWRPRRECKFLEFPWFLTIAHLFQPIDHRKSFGCTNWNVFAMHPSESSVAYSIDNCFFFHFKYLQYPHPTYS